jgi:hypothetical protein
MVPPQLHLFQILIENGLYLIMLFRIIPLIALVAGVHAHGYLSSPMSRTGLNAQVRMLLICCIFEPSH